MADQVWTGGSPLLVAYSDGIRIPTYGYGLCGCGCGHQTPIAKKTSTHYGIRKGQPKLFVRGHHTRKATPDFKYQDWGFKTPCWVWLKKCDKDGYPQVSIGELNCRATHVYFEHFTGKKVPDGMHLNHKCRIHPCVNHDHLEIATPADNVRYSGSTQFDGDAVRKMIAMRKQGAQFKEIAETFQTSVRYLKRICYGERWRGIVPESDLPKHVRHLSKDQALEILDLRRQGISVKAIAAQFDVPFNRIYYVLDHAETGYKDRHQIGKIGCRTVESASS